MAKDPITTTQFAKREDRTVEFGDGRPATDQQSQARNTENDQKISVRALRRFHQEANMQGEMVSPGDEFECPRGRAAELRANGLIEYVNDSEGKKIHGEDGAQRLDERVRREQEQAQIPERHKTTPLQNPELKLAEVAAADKSKK